MSWIRKMLKPLMIVAPYVLRNSQTVAYPTERLMFFERFRGRHVFHLDKCISCGICARVCPDASIELVEIEGKDKKYPQIDYHMLSLRLLRRALPETGAGVHRHRRVRDSGPQRAGVLP
jgi:ferredoxin